MRGITGADDQRIPPRERKVGLHHLAHQFVEADAGLPAEFLARLGRIPQQRFDFRGPVVARIDGDDAFAAAGVRIRGRVGDDAMLVRAFAAPFDAATVVSTVLIDGSPKRRATFSVAGLM